MSSAGNEMERKQRQRNTGRALRYHPLALAAAFVSSSLSTAAFAVESAATSSGSRAVRSGKPADTVVDEGPDALERSVPAAQAEVDDSPMEMEFNPAFFTGNVADLSRYTHGNPVLPGTYSAEITVNGRGFGQMEVVFREVPGKTIAAPCFSIETLEKLGVDTARVVKRLKNLDPEGNIDALGIEALAGTLPKGACLPIGETVPSAKVSFDTSDFKLDISVPQIEMRNVPRGYVEPSRWSEGVNAGLLQYNFSSYTSHQASSSDTTSAFLGLQGGFNFGGWRFRQRSNVNWQSTGGARWTNLATYLQHDLTGLRSQLTLGDSYTSGDIFDAFNVRGVQISSDDRMLPDSMRSYAPTVRGVAETNARVVVRQNNYILYETSVPPGPFELTDLPATGYGGDLDVTVTEADGRSRRFAVPFASVAQLLRPGVSRFNVTAGQYRDSLISSSPMVAQATYQRGLSNLVTAYGGLLGTTGYGSGLLGVALNTPVGAVALDATLARTNLPGDASRQGQSWRVSYSKLMPGTNTNFTMAAYRYSTSGFYSLRDAVYARNVVDDTSNLSNFRARSRVQLNVSQPVGERSSFYVAGSSQNYWEGNRATDLQYQIGFNSAFKSVSYSVYAQRSRNAASGRFDTQVGLNISIPLGRDSYVKRNTFDVITANLTRGSNSTNNTQITASGSTAGDASINYGVTALRNETAGSRLTSLGGYGTYRTPFGTYSANASVGDGMRQASVNAEGALVAHAGGVTLGPPVGMAAALIEAKGAEGAKIINGQGARIDSNGYALLPSLMPYRLNTVAVDPEGMSDEAELESTSEEVVPRADALMLVRIKTKQGRPLFASMEGPDGEGLPMGTDVLDASGNSVGTVGQGGMAFLRGVEGTGTLTARWGMGPNEQCALPYSISPSEPGDRRSMLTRVRLRCVPMLDQ